MSSPRLRRAGLAGLSALVVAAGVPLLLTSAGSPAAAQETPTPCSSTPTPTISPSATATVTTSPSDTATVTPSASATVTTAPSATATATPTATVSPTSPAPGCTAPTPSPTAPLARRLTISAGPSVITPGVTSVVTVRGDAGTVVLLYAYSRPSTEYKVVRRAIIGTSGVTTFRLLPGTNTRLFAAVSGQTGNESASTTISVRTALSLSVVRNGSLTYTFQGSVLPRRAGQVVSLYRIFDTREILTARATTDADGVYRIRRTFTGTGSFPFITRTGQTLTNAAGISNSGKATAVTIKR